jgi:hypothetical protein
LFADCRRIGFAGLPFHLAYQPLHPPRTHERFGRFRTRVGGKRGATQGGRVIQSLI